MSNHTDTRRPLTFSKLFTWFVIPALHVIAVLGFFSQRPFSWMLLNKINKKVLNINHGQKSDIERKKRKYAIAAKKRTHFRKTKRREKNHRSLNNFSKLQKTWTNGHKRFLRVTIDWIVQSLLLDCNQNFWKKPTLQDTWCYWERL